MPRPSVIPQVKERLERYLEGCEAAYLGQLERDRLPTLPSTADGKVNVRAVAQAIDLRQTQEKYLYEREELSSLVNLVAEGQGLLPIGARLLQDAGDKAIKDRLLRQGQASKAAAQAAIEAQAIRAELVEKLKDAVFEAESLKAENMRLRAQIDSMDAGLYIRVSN